MKGIPELKKLIEDDIEKLTYPDTPLNLYQPIRYILGLGGKRVRPLLMLISHQLFDNNIQRSLSTSIAIEVFHNFTLLHDDIMDNAPIRRGKQTVHEKWNKNVAILAGDAMMIDAYRLIVNSKIPNMSKVLDVFNKAAKDVCEGQQLDMDFELRNDVNIDEYLKMIEYKTSVLIAASLQIGSINAGASKEDSEAIYKFGKYMGIAFQLKDDLLDTFGESDAFGKQVGGDIISNKKTYLYLRALQETSEKQKEDLLRHFSFDSRTNEENDRKIRDIQEIFLDIDIPKKTMMIIEKYYQKSLDYLETINSPNKDILLDFCNSLVYRHK